MTIDNIKNIKNNMLATLYQTTLKQVRKDTRLLRSLYSLTLPGKSEMRNEIDKVCSDELAERYEIVYVEVDGKVVGWVMTFPLFWYKKSGKTYCSTHYYAYFYVAGKYRRFGIGSKLFKAAKSICEKKKKKMFCVPWNKVSASFFKKNNALVDFKYYHSY